MDAFEAGALQETPRDPALGIESGEPDNARGSQAIFELAPIGIARIAADGRFLMANSRLCQLLGYPREELLTRTFEGITFPDDVREGATPIARVAEGAIPRHRCQTRFMRRDGSVLPVRVTLSATRDEDETVTSFVELVEDVSGENEEARIEAEERLAAALESSDTGTFHWDVQSNEFGWDVPLDRLLGIAPGDVEHTRDAFLARVHSDDRSRVDVGLRDCAANATAFDEEFRVVRPDGSVRWLWGKGRVRARSRDGGLILTGACTDTTERKRVEEELVAETRRVRENEARLRALVRASPLGIDIMDLTGNPIFYNPKAEELHGIRFERASGRGWTSALHPDDRERIANSWYAAATAGRAWAETYRFLHPDGRVVWVSGRAEPMWVEGEMVGYVGTLEDITALKVAEAERERLLARERDARAEAERAMKRRDEVMAIVAHDLRNPVHTIVASASFMLDSRQTEQEREKLLRLILRAATSMDRQIGDLLDIAQIESGTFVIVPTKLDLSGLLVGMAELFEAKARDAGVMLKLDVQPDLPSAYADVDRIGQALSNLVANAIKFTPAGGSVVVRARRADRRLEVVVEDTGDGIPPEQLPRVFDRFWRDASKPQPGAGLGLAITRAIVEAHGGSVEVESTPGRGSTFRFRIPMAEDR